MVFLEKNGKHLHATDSANVQNDEVGFMELRYRFQKNNDNGQKIKYSKSNNTQLCPLVAKEVYNLILPKDIKRFSSHFIRVVACVLLQSSGKDGELIKLRLSLKSDTFRLYLRNTTLLA
eukprot:15336242-Ditylum_brightwellii.AAC.1